MKEMIPDFTVVLHDSNGVNFVAPVKLVEAIVWFKDVNGWQAMPHAKISKENRRRIISAFMERQLALRRMAEGVQG